jgi:hypothetical protein
MQQIPAPERTRFHVRKATRRTPPKPPVSGLQELPCRLR